MSFASWRKCGFQVHSSRDPSWQGPRLVGIGAEKDGTRAIPSARAPLLDTAPSLKDTSLPLLVWPHPPMGRISRATLALKRRSIWPGVATYQAKMSKQNRDRNLILKPFDITDDRAEAARLSVPLPDQRLARFVQRFEGLIQPCDMDVILTLAPDAASVDLDIAHSGRLDLLTGASVFCRTHSGFDVLRLEGAERDAAISAYSLTLLVVLARSFESSLTGPMPRLSVPLTLAGLPETRKAQLTIDARGWGFGLAESTVGLPAIPACLPDGIALQIDPVEKGVPSSVAAVPPIRAKGAVRPIRTSLCKDGQSDPFAAPS